MALTPNQQETYRKWKENVNMSKSELQRFYDSDEGKEAGLSKSEADRQGIDYGRESARWILKMKDTPVTEWTDAMWRWAGKQNSFISRMSGVEGPLYQKNGKKSRKHLSLLIWGNNPEKMQNGGKIKGTTPAKVNKELKRLGINGEIIRDRSGYYYFIGDLFDVVPSIYSYNLNGWSTGEIIDWVKKGIKESELAKGGKLSELEKIKKESENLINIEPEGLYEGGLDAPFFQKGGSISTLLAPNGQPSNLTPEQYRLVRTPEFKAWFGDWENDTANASKVVDENGEPLVQYHSSIYEFNVFDKEKSDLFGWHFGSKKASEKVGKQRQRQKKDELLEYKIKPYFLNIRKPYEILDTNDHKKPHTLYYQIHTFFNDFKINKENLIAWGQNDYISDDKVDYYKKIIQGNKKYDGFWYWNRYEDKNNKYPSWVAKNPNQIKLADGSNTTFDANNPDIRFEGGGTTGQKKSPLDTILELAKPYQEELTDQWAAQMKKSDQPVSEWDIEEYKLMLVLDLIKAVGRYLNATDTVKDVSLSKHKGVIEIKARVERDGQEYYFGTNMIVAGGNNIQVRHFRYLVDTKLPSKNTNPEYESLKKELKRLTGIEKIKKDIDFENKRLEALKEKLETAKKNTELSDSQIEAIERKREQKNWQQYIDITWDEIVRRGADKNYDYDESNFLKSKQEYRLFLINSWKNSYANVKGTEFQIKSKEKEIEKLNKKIAALGGYSHGGVTETLLAPNGQHSNLTPEQWHLVRTPEFKAWFGDWQNDPKNASKVVDENGEPLVCYHGSPVQNINVFRIKEGAKNKSRMQLLFGTHFAKSKEDASIYAGDKGKIYEVFLSIKNPIDLSSGYISRGHKDFEKLYSLVLDLKLLKKFRTVFDYELFDESGNYGGKSDLIQRIFVTQQMLDSMAPKVVMDALLKNGFDGVVYTPYQPVLYNLAVNFSNSFISFYPNQIKLADASNTTFDPNNPDIRFRDGGSTGTLLAPNGKPSNLTPEQWHLVRTPEFKAWFGDWQNDPQNASKVLDANGEPLVVFHGTTSDFNTFRFSEFGFHFGTLQQAEKRIARFRLLNMYYRIIPCFINLRNPITTKDLFTWESQDVANELLSLGVFSKSEHKTYKYRPIGIIIDSLLAKKIDGLKYLNLYEGDGYSYSVFEPNNIKLADGSNTTFDGFNPDIRFDKGGRTIAQTPAPAKERIYGSDVNKSGSAKSSQSAKEIRFSPDVIKGLKNKVREFNAKHSEKVSLDTLKAVYRRGAGAYSVSHRPTISGGVPNSRNAWAMARVNAFLKKKAGQNVKDAYVQDDDLLQDGGQLKGRTINAENYFDGTSCVFDPLPVKDAIEILDAYRLWRRKKNKPEYIETKNFGNLTVDFSSERKNSFFKSRSVSYYFVSENKDFVIRISDHWSKSNYPKSKKLSCGNIRSCFWENYGESFSYHLWGQAYSSVLIGGVCGFSQFQDNKFESGGKLSKEAYEGKREWASKKMADMKMITTLTEEQHDVLAELCSFRHELHTNQESLFNTESANYPFFNEMLSGGINEKLKEVGLPEIKSLDVLYDDFPTDMDIFYDIAEFETNEEGLEIALQRASEINSAIEGYLLEIDKQHGTSYCPSGYTRLYADGGSTGTLLAPNGKPSNLTPEQYRLVRTPEFKAWFGDWQNDPKNASKVVDENGEPLVCYHGTNKEFYSFDEKFNNYKGFYFSAYKNYSYIAKYTKIVLPCFLQIKNPPKIEPLKMGLHRQYVVFDNQFLALSFLDIQPDEYNKIKKLGFDGMIGDIKDGDYELKNAELVVFSPTQIKLADGSNTTFDANNPDIRFEEGGEVENLISQGVVELRMFDTKPEHAKEYGFDSKNPLYIDNLFIAKDYRLKGIGSKVLRYIIDYAIKNEHDVIFGHITQKAEPKIDVIKSMLIKSGFNTCEGNNDFYKILADDSNTAITPSNPDIRFADGGSTGTLLAPNGKPSNLTPEQWHLVRTSEFKAWFGDWENDPENASKAVDKNGEPLVVYHGTPDARFSVFDKERFRTRSKSPNSKGFFFTPEIWYAKAYSESSNNEYREKAKEVLGYYPKTIEERPYAKELPCFLNIRNPKYANDSLLDTILASKDNDGLIVFYNPSVYNEFVKDKIFEIAVFDSTQIKLADGSNTTFYGSNPDIRFADGGEIPNLVALHNINSYQLKEADKLGGLVTPSIAIVKTGQSFADFGEITLVGTKDLVDPKNPYVKAFSGDIYSQTVPAKQYYVNKSVLGKVVRELVNKAYNYSKGEIANKLDNIIGDFTDFQKNLNRYSYDQLIAKYEKPLRLAYIVDKNIYIKIPMKQRYSRFGNNITMKLDSRQKRYIEPIFEKYKENESKGVESKNEEAKIYDFLMDIINDHYKPYIEAINDPEETQERKDMLRSRIETFVTKYLGEKGDITGYAINSLSDALRTNLELDEEKLDKVLSSAITGEAKIEYEKWLSDFINQFRGAAYFEIGKEKYPYSLEYLIDATAGKLRGKEETGTFGPNKAKSFAVKEFASLQDIKKSADKLVSKQEMKEIDESIKQGFFSLADQLKYRYSGQWEKLDSLGKALSSYFKGASASTALSRNDFVKIDNDEIDLFKEFAANLRSVPSDYFEAKIGRAVKISEFRYAVVPKSTDKETLEILKKNGVKFKKYATQDERRDIVNDLVSSKKGLAFEDGGLVSEKQIALPDAYVSESSLKDVLDRQGYILQRKEKAGLGMLKPVKNITEIAKEKNVPLAYAKEQLDNGIQVEMEHTGHYEVAKQIALHHLNEGINYYIELAKVEKKVKNEE